MPKTSPFRRFLRGNLSPSIYISKLVAHLCNFREYCRALLRALGFNLMFASARGLAGKTIDEPVKVVIHRNRAIALLHATIHVIPVGVALTEIYLNWHGTFLGANMRGLSYLQFGAKAHELTILASLSAMLFSYVRRELSVGEGLPFGALMSGFQFTQISYLWSMELWGASFSNMRVWRKLNMIAVIIIGVSLAAIAGPSSAILLIPRLDYWPAGYTHIWINATTDNLWPTYLNGSVVPQHCSIVSNSSRDCPSHEWQSIGTYLSLANNIVPAAYQGPYMISPFSVQLTGQSSLRQLIIQHHIYDNTSAGYDHEAAQSTTQQGVIADALTSISALWISGLQRSNSRLKNQRDAAQTIVSNYYQPYTLVSCGSDLIQGESDLRPVAFPIPPGSSPQMLSTSNVTESLLQMPAIIYSGLTRTQILETPGPTENYRIRWVELPQDLFNGTTIGAVAIPPSHNSTQKIIVCNLSAGWGSSMLNMSSTPSVSKTDLVASRIYDPSGALTNDNNYMKRTVDSIISFELPQFPQRVIKVDQSWAQYLSPDDPGSNMTVFSALMASKMLKVEDSVSVRIILAGLLANGLSRLSHTSQLQGKLRTIPDPESNFSIPDGPYWFGGKGDVFSVSPEHSKEWIKLRVDSTVEGFAYSIRGTAPKLAVATLICYCVFAVTHFIYTASSGTSFTCWNSIAEIAALAMNSTPTEKLRNTCAGISQTHIFKLPVRILASSGLSDSGEHLELVFGDVDKRTLANGRVRENRLYGETPSFKS